MEKSCFKLVLKADAGQFKASQGFQTKAQTVSIITFQSKDKRQKSTSGCHC